MKKSRVVPPEESCVEIDLEDRLLVPGPVPKHEGVVVGRLSGFDTSDAPLVQFHGNPLGEPVTARAICALEPTSVGVEVALMFEGGDLSRPIVFGVIQRCAGSSPARSDAADRVRDSLAVEVDEERIEISAKQEVVIRVGKASITLTRAGKVLIRGTYLLSRSSGVNRVKGGSVQIN